MPRRKDTFISGAYYHIFNRVIEGEDLFRESKNYLYCIQLIKRYSLKYEINVIAYCLMPNHYHFLLEQRSNQPVSTFVSMLFNSYVQKMNQIWDRKGLLFRARFKHVLVDRDEYLIHLCRYIHLNPVKAKLVSHPGDWYYSNYLDWVGLRKGELMDPESRMNFFRSGQEYQDFVLDYDDKLEPEKEISKLLLE